VKRGWSVNTASHKAKPKNDICKHGKLIDISFYARACPHAQGEDPHRSILNSQHFKSVQGSRKCRMCHLSLA
jgi:hypothetical protein